LKSGLLAWIEMQLLHGVERGVEWLKILENILIIVNPGKIEAATNGDWRRIICRCLCHLLDRRLRTLFVVRLVLCFLIDCLANNLAHAGPVIFRLAALSGPDQSGFSTLLTLAFRSLEKLEAQIQVVAFETPMLEKRPSKYTLPTPPHRSTTLHQRISFETILEPEQRLLLWGKLLDILLQSCMFVNRKPPVWDVLVPRSLLWRSLKGSMGDDDEISEWTRREVILNLQSGVHKCPTELPRVLRASIGIIA
jgi:nucleolar pre-ribosomal-associated protein 1